MADRRRRSAEEREAARLERERRRAERAGGRPTPIAGPPRPSPAADPGCARTVAAGRTPRGRCRAATRARARARWTPRRAVTPGRCRDRRRRGHDGRGRRRAWPGAGRRPRVDAAPDRTRSRETPSGTRRVSRSEPPAERPAAIGPAAARSPVPPRRRKAVRPARERTPSRRAGTPGSAGSSRCWRWCWPLALIWFLVQLFQPFAGSPHGSVTVTIPAASTSSQIGDLLARDGVIPSSFFFELRATLAGERGSLRPATTT